MINSINHTHIMQNIPKPKSANSVSTAKASEEANESMSEKAKEATMENSKATSKHTIDSYA